MEGSNGSGASDFIHGFGVQRRRRRQVLEVGRAVAVVGRDGEKEEKYIRIF